LFSSVPKLKRPIACSQKHDGKIPSYARWQAHMLAFRSGRSRQSFLVFIAKIVAKIMKVKNFRDALDAHTMHVKCTC
jgi:hypothetical protein